MKLLIAKDHAGADVDALAAALARELAEDAGDFPVLARAGAAVDDTFDAAIRRWQAGVGVIADGIVGPLCQVLLDLAPMDLSAFKETPLTVAAVSRLFPATKPANIARYLPYVEAALALHGLTDAPLVLAALGTIRADAEGFVPMAAAGKEDAFRGRGFVRLAGEARYARYAALLGLPLVHRPELANAPEVAALLLAQVLLENAESVRAEVKAGRLGEARALIERASRGAVSADRAADARFAGVFELAAAGWDAALPTAGAGARGAAERRAALGVGKTKKDAADLRDRPYLPPPVSLPPVCPSAEEVQAFLPRYAEANLVLDQGKEGACTGFGLACVVNYLRWVQAGNPVKDFQSVSPRMLYTLARRHDEYAGENYEGSSCRGAIKGWFNNGVCLEPDWPYAPSRSHPPRYGYARRAAQHTLGVYYRVETKSITDLQAAIHQHRAVFASAFTHAGWDLAEQAEPPRTHAELPLIEFDGRPSQEGGHAFALVGFDTRGFIVQNSWGREWGASGFAVLTYADWLANAMDAWVVALGVPGVVAGRLATAGAGDAKSRAGGADRSRWWDTGLAYQHSVVLGNDGRVARYLTEDEKPRKLQQQAYALPDQWFRSLPAGAPKRVVVYAHGGLNSEEAAIQRASAMGRFFTGNGCYPLFLVWKTGLLETLGHIVSDAARREPARAGAGEWLTDKTDLLIEKTLGRPLGRPIWAEMKENAELAFAARRGGELLLDALAALAETWGPQFELHVVGHSAGSIVLGHLLTALRQRHGRPGGLAERLASVHLYAPACTVGFAVRHYASDPRVMQRLHLDVLADKVERDDTVGAVYRKSLLYLVSNALEADLRTPILGLQRIDAPDDAGWDGTSDSGETLAAWRAAAEAARLDERKAVLAADRIRVALDARGAPVLGRAAHGSFDNDVAVVSRTLQRITQAGLKTPVDDLRGY